MTSNRSHTGTAPRRGMTITELLVAVTISLVFVSSIGMAFIQVSNATDAAQAAIRAHTRARNAVDQIARDLRRVQPQSFGRYGPEHFLLTDQTLPQGDFTDQDLDGNADEEVFNGLDDDGDWTAPDDRHAEIEPGRYERGQYRGMPDLGDAHLDEDVKFSRDSVTIFFGGDPANPDAITQQITYRIGTFQGRDNVLLRDVVDLPGTTTETTTTQPLVFDCMSLDMLGWNANSDSTAPDGTSRPYWTSTWDATTLQFPDQKPYGAPDGVPPFEFPASMLIRVTVCAERFPLSTFGWPGNHKPIRTEWQQSIVNLEATIDDIRYKLYVRPD